MDRITNKKLFIIVAALLAFLAVSMVLLLTGVAQEFFMSIGIYEESEKNIEVNYYEYVPKGAADTIIFEDSILVADQSGVSCYSKDGIWLWSKELSLTNPVLLKTDKKIIVADIGGTGIHFFGRNGFTETYLAPDTIIGISENTVKNLLCVIHKADSYLSAVTLLEFSEDVKPIATRKFGEYYMSSASIAPSGEKFTVSGIKSDEEGYRAVSVTLLTDRLAVEDTDENIAVTWLPITHYVKENTIVFAGGEGIVVKQRDEKTSIEGSFSAVKFDGSDIYAVCSDGERHLVRRYSLSGKISDEFEVRGRADNLEIYKNTLVLFNENEMLIYNRYGHFLGQVNEISQIADISFTGKRQFFIAGGSKTAEVNVG